MNIVAELRDAGCKVAIRTSSPFRIPSSMSFTVQFPVNLPKPFRWLRKFIYSIKMHTEVLLLVGKTTGTVLSRTLCLTKPHVLEGLLVRNNCKERICSRRTDYCKRLPNKYSLLRGHRNQRVLNRPTFARQSASRLVVKSFN
jgi:hypothetical protein